MPSPLSDSLRRDVRSGGRWLYSAHLATVVALGYSNIFLGLTILWSMVRWRRLPWSWARDRKLLLPLAFYLLFLVISVIYSFEPKVSVERLREAFSLAPLVLAPVLVRGTREVRRLYDLLIAILVLLALYGIWQYYFTDFGDLHQRIRGPFSHYLTYSGVLQIGSFLLLARLASRDRWRNPWSWLAFALINWSLLLSLARSSWVALALTGGAFVLFHSRRLFAGLAVLLVVLGLIAPDSWRERLRSIGDLRNVSNYDRLCMVDAGLYMIAERPLFGLGPEMVEQRYPIYRHPTAPRVTVPHLHNTYLQLAAERGLTSLAAFLWLLAASLRLAWRGYRREGGIDGERADLYLGAVLSILGFAVAGLFEANWRDTEVQRIPLFLLAVPCCLAAMPKGTSAPGPERTSDTGGGD